jgi:hypothetical protein
MTIRTTHSTKTLIEAARLFDEGFGYAAAASSLHYLNTQFEIG